MIVHVVSVDGVAIGQFEEPDFRNKIAHGEFGADCYYWHPGIPDWKPISEYRPPGRVTTILDNIPTREMKRQELAGKRSKPVSAVRDKLKGIFRKSR